MRDLTWTGRIIARLGLVGFAGLVSDAASYPLYGTAPGERSRRGAGDHVVVETHANPEHVNAATVSGGGPDPFLRLRRKEVDASSVM